MTKTSIMNVEGIEIALTTINDEDYISLTDIIKAKDGDFFISDWLRNRNTLEYLGAWESMSNPDFNYGEFAIIKSKAGLALSWNVKRLLSKANYHIHTDAIKNVILPKLNISQMKQGIVYASEADLLNMALFGCTAKQWQEANPELIKQGLTKEARFAILHRTAEEQLAVLIARNAEQNFAKLVSEDPKLIE